MDQDSFRQLLQTPHAGTSNGTSTISRGSLLASISKSKPKTVDGSQPAFKPRKVKKTESQYRDRAAERRVGEGNDFAEVEAVLEDFERRTADSEDKDAIEEQRRYLGGDRDHSILVKGLDFALLQQNKARAAQTTNDDDSLEQAFQEVSTESRVPKKRTREDIIKELKDKRQQGAASEELAKDEAVLLEEAKKAGKFKPIGFKQIDTPAKGKTKKKKGKELENDGERKKKRKIEGESAEQKAKQEMPAPQFPEKISHPASSPAEPKPEPIPEAFDIFADAGDYEGIDLGDDDEDDDEDAGAKKGIPATESLEESSTIPRQRWFETDEDQRPQSDTSKIAELTAKAHSPPPPASDEEDLEQPTRLVPLETSAIPSIRDLLAMDGAQDKRKKRKDKKKGGKDSNPKEKKVTAEAKVDRDYKRLKSYTEKKASASSSTG